ncbi:hypothetical protein SESBI_39228 [Sesbania bispinosa]|nr:hypothetical protein SESBI_39228 [Sesbania bispinosa]
MKLPLGFASVLSLDLSASAVAALCCLCSLQQQSLPSSYSSHCLQVPKPHQTLLSLCCHQARPLQTYNKWTLLCPICNSAICFALSYLKQVEHVDLKDGVLGEAADGNSAEDTAKDDMFVDCPDELTTFAGRQKEEEGAATENEGDIDKSEENQVMHQQQSHFVELNNGEGDGYPTGELEQLRLSLEKAVAEKERIVKEYQEEKETVAQGVFDLHYRLKTLTCY